MIMNKRRKRKKEKRRVGWKSHFIGGEKGKKDDPKKRNGMLEVKRKVLGSEET